MNRELINQNSAAPTRKTTFGAYTAGILVALLAVFYPEEYGRLPIGTELAIGGFIMKVVEYFTKERLA